MQAQGKVAWHERGGPVLLLCLALAALAHGGSVREGFYNDDAIFLNQASRVLEAPSSLFTERPLGYFRPAWSAYVSAQWLFFGLAPMGYHVVGILLHGLTGFLVWRLARRVLRGRGDATAGADSVPALFAATAFLCLFAHAEGVVWIAAHNSILACALCVAACLTHLHAVERGGIGRGLLAALIALLALLTKEPSAVLLAWLPCTQMAVFGWRSVFTRASWGRWVALLAAVALFVALNGRVGTAFTKGSEAPVDEVRGAIAFISLPRALGACAWMFSPVSHTDETPSAWWGVLALALALLPVLLRRRNLLPAALLGATLLFTAMVPASMTRNQQPNGSRLYYFPTVGAALLLGSFVAALGTRRVAGAAEPAGPAGAPTRTPKIVLVAAVAYLGVLVAADRRFEREDYRPVSLAQTRLAEQLAPTLEQAGHRPVLLLEPWINNLMHVRQFAQLYAGVSPERVTLLSIDRVQGQAWLAAQRGAGAVVLDWDAERGLVPAERMPPARNSLPGAPRGAVAAADASPRIRVVRIAPP